MADKGYHSNRIVQDLTELDIRTYISEPERGRRNWKKNESARDAVYGNRRRIRGVRGRELLRRRGEFLERPFAHAYETGRLRRVYLRGRSNILLIHTAALNLGLLMRTLVGVGTPRSLQGRLRALAANLFGHLEQVLGRLYELLRAVPPFWSAQPQLVPLSRKWAFTTGC